MNSLTLSLFAAVAMTTACASAPAPKADAAPTAPAAEAPATETPATEAPATEAPATETPATEAAAGGGEAAAPVATPETKTAALVLVPVAFDLAPEAGTKAKCAVSGEEFVVAKDTVRAEHGGKHFVFCCPGCSGTFGENPGQYAQK